MLYLVFDLGNSRAKLARFAGDGLDFVTVLPVERFTTDPAGALEPFGEVEGALGVSSHPQAYKILREYLERRGIEPVSARERCPLVVEYGEGLGDDRVLAANAAVDSLGAPCAVVGCGTAVTVDLVRVRNEEPVFVGGAILAGEGIVLRGLGGLESLPRLEPDAEVTGPAYGSTTEECLRLGAFVQVGAAIERLLVGYADYLGVTMQRLPVLFHGGDAGRYASGYPSALVSRYAVLEGCARLARGR